MATLNNDKVGIQGGLANLIIAYQQIGDYKLAKRYGKHAIEIWEEDGEPKYLADLLHTMIGLYNQLTDREEQKLYLARLEELSAKHQKF